MECTLRLVDNFGPMNITNVHTFSNKYLTYTLVANECNIKQVVFYKMTVFEVRTNESTNISSFDTFYA